MKRKAYIYFDNYFTSFAVVQKLKLIDVASCVIIGSNRKGILTLKEDRELGI
jgi:hypothetical protein